MTKSIKSEAQIAAEAALVAAEAALAVAQAAVSAAREIAQQTADAESSLNEEADTADKLSVWQEEAAATKKREQREQERARNEADSVARLLGSLGSSPYIPSYTSGTSRMNESSRNIINHY